MARNSFFFFCVWFGHNFNPKHWVLCNLCLYSVRVRVEELTKPTNATYPPAFVETDFIIKWLRAAISTYTLALGAIELKAVVLVLGDIVYMGMSTHGNRKEFQNKISRK